MEQREKGLGIQLASAPTEKLFRRQAHCTSYKGGKVIKKERVKRETQRILIKIKMLRTKLVMKPKDTKRRKI